MFLVFTQGPYDPETAEQSFAGIATDLAQAKRVAFAQWGEVKEIFDVEGRQWWRFSERDGDWITGPGTETEVSE